MAKQAKKKTSPSKPAAKKLPARKPAAKKPAVKKAAVKSSAKQSAAVATRSSAAKKPAAVTKQAKKAVPASKVLTRSGSAKAPAKPVGKVAPKGAAKKPAAQTKRKALGAVSVPGALADATARPEFVEHASPSMPGEETAQARRAAREQEGDALPADVKLAFAIQAARLVKDDNCEDVVVLDVRGSSHVSDYIVIGSGTSDRQMRSVLEHVEKLGAERGFQAFRSSRDDRATWLLLDFVDVVVHLFEPSTRSHYDLEMLWGDSPRVDWERADQRSRDRAGVGSK